MATMATTHQDGRDKFKAEGCETLATILEGRHGVFAAEVADFLASVHGRLGDVKRCTAWGEVAQLVRSRESVRLATS